MCIRDMTDAVNKGLIVKRDLDGGQMSHDMTLYVDEDGKARSEERRVGKECRL